MNNTDTYLPDWVSPPGETISDILRERKISVAEFAELMGTAPDDITNLLRGRVPITISAARRLTRVLGSSVEFWMSRDFQYHEGVQRIRQMDAGWLTLLPVHEMSQFGWLDPAPSASEEFEACLRFFDVPSVRAWHQSTARVAEAAAFRTSPSFDSHPGAVAAWLRQGEIEAEAIECDPWDAEQFQDSLVLIRSLTRQKDPSKFIPELRQICAKNGVAVVVVRAPKGCRASGAARFVSPGKGLIQLSFRYLTDNHFWFTFFHEAGHLILHGDTRLFLEGTDDESSSEEHESNEFAAASLVPPEDQATMLGLGADYRDVMRFAARVKVAPGIVVGQLQHHKRLRPSQLNQLKRRFEWKE